MTTIDVCAIRQSFAVLITATIALLLAACSANLKPAANEAGAAINADPNAAAARVTGSPKPLRIALLLPLAGFDQTAAVAKGIKQAAEMALFERDNPNVQLIVKDDKGTVEGGRLAAEKAISEGAEIILGPLLSDAVAGAAAVARQANIPIVAFSNNRRVASNGVYLMSYLPEPEVERIVSFAASKGKRRFAALLPDDEYGRAIEPVFRNAVTRAGGTVAILERYPSRANEMLDAANRAVDKIKQSAFEGVPVDALFVPGGQDVLPRLGPLIAYSGVETAQVKLLGTGAWAFPNIGRDTAFIGGWYPSPDPVGWRAFSGRFANTFGSAPPRLASLSYDAVNLAISKLHLPPGQRFTPASLTDPAGFRGVDGLVRLRADGTSERALAILEVQKFGAQVIDAAPAVLSPAVN